MQEKYFKIKEGSWHLYSYDITMKLMGMYFSERQLEMLQKESKENGLSVSEIVRRILDSYYFGEPAKNTKFDKLKKC